MQADHPITDRPRCIRAWRPVTLGARRLERPHQIKTADVLEIVEADAGDVTDKSIDGRKKAVLGGSNMLVESSRVTH